MKNKPFTFLLCVCLVFLFLFIPMMGCSTLVEGTCSSVTNCALFAGYAGYSCTQAIFPAIKPLSFFEVERKWACGELTVETFIFGGDRAHARGSGGNDACATLRVEGRTIQLGFLYRSPGAQQSFYIPLTEEEKARKEAGERVSITYVWNVSTDLKDKTLTITVTHDFGYEDGLYFSDFKGRTFVLTEQSRVF